MSIQNTCPECGTPVVERTDGYGLVGGDTAAKKMIGNAVCLDLAKALILETLSA